MANTTIPTNKVIVVINAADDDIKLLLDELTILEPSSETAPNANTSSNQPKFSFPYSEKSVEITLATFISNDSNINHKQLNIINAGNIKLCIFAVICGTKKLTGPNKTTIVIGNEIIGENIAELAKGFSIIFLKSLVLSNHTKSSFKKITVRIK